MKDSLLAFLGTFFIVMTVDYFMGDENCDCDTNNIESNYKPSDFKTNYQIDLKQDGYLILDQYDEVYYVPYGQLEDWFLEDNM